MKFFMPELDDEEVAKQLEAIRQRPGRAIFKMKYEHDRSRFEVEVGKPRKEFRHKTGPRGGYIKDADIERLGRDTGGTVVRIVDLGDVIEVYALPGLGWSVPSFVGRAELTEPPDYFEEFG